MSGVQGVPTSVSNAVGAARANGSLSVDPEALLRASNTLDLESKDLLTEIANYRDQALLPCGPDPVSGPAASSFQAKITALLDQATAYATSLGNASVTLKEQANRYGATDQQAKQALQQAGAERAKYIANLAASQSSKLVPPTASPTSGLAQQYSPQRAPGDLRPLADRPASYTDNPFLGLEGGPR